VSGEIYVVATGQQDTVMQIMFGGRTRGGCRLISDLSTNRKSAGLSPLLATSVKTHLSRNVLPGQYGSAQNERKFTSNFI
jgi:hypothetical protein